MCAAGFPEPYTFSLRARELLRGRRHDFDVVHDNQCLGTGLLGDDARRRLAGRRPPCTTRSRSTATSTWRTRRRRGGGLALRRWYGFLEMQMRVARSRCRASSPCRENSRARHRRPDGRRSGDGCTSCRSASTHDVPADARTCSACPVDLMTTASADVPMKGLALLARGAREAAHRARGRATSWSSASRRSKSTIPAHASSGSA